ncbi:unnamed protein product, partial [Didymodactylos carnosus]
YPNHEGQYYSFPFTKSALSTGLMLLKARHRLTRSCVTDICRLMSNCRVPNTPLSYQVVKYTLEQDMIDELDTETYYICTSCYHASKRRESCANEKCHENNLFEKPPSSFYTFCVRHQIEHILRNLNVQLNIRPQKNSSMIDISDGDFYQNILSLENDDFITFVLNVDGISLSDSSDQSLWIFLMIINEIPRNVRFQLQNIIIPGIWPGPKKPTNPELQTMLSIIVDELVDLEEAVDYYVKSSDSILPLKSFLISLVGNVAAFNAEYGCTNCLIQGTKIKAGKVNRRTGQQNTIRVFPSGDDQEVLRTNETYDSSILDLTMKKRKKKIKKNKKVLKEGVNGHYGICALRALKYFEMGASFAVDSLHTICRGAMNRLLTLWLDGSYKGENYSVCNRLTEINERLSSIRYPSTTSRKPRSLTKYYRYKGA